MEGDMAKPNGEIRNICILTTQRSGSTWLMQLLNNTGYVRAFGEVFLEWASIKDHGGDRKLLPPLFFKDFQEHTGSRKVGAYLQLLEESEKGPIAFKVMYDQVRRNPAILITAIARGYTIVHLTRQNLLDIVTSRLLARATRVYHSASQIEQPQIIADADTVMAMLKRIDWQMRIATTLLKILPIAKTSISYESIVDQPEIEVRRLLNAAGIREAEPALRPASGNWVKTNTRTPDQIFVHYAGIASAISQSRFSWMLGEKAPLAEGSLSDMA
jgi:LPS sulfotransferase NodH